MRQAAIFSQNLMVPPRGLGRPCPNDFAASQWVTTDRDSIRQECPVLMGAAHHTPTE